ncbi:MAG TPA: nicotinate-nucleotide--dimethylbenzimidazole phosphoribosyltransferase [Candidatus Baltobacteraceae bacterium]|jgi:nicotinate-nucleotide--dimethylbenzimidazole phosphoribosyltransferase
MNLPRIPLPDPAIAKAARERVDQLTKPLGSLGRIEDLAVRLCAITGGVPKHAFERRAVLIGAADHGVARDGVSAYPPEVTAQMVGGFCAGFAAISAFAREAGADVFVADFGVDAELAPHPQLFDLKVARGTASLAHGPAMSHDDVERALGAGIEAFNRVRERMGRLDIIALGDMGIGNTTSAAALIAIFSTTPVGLVVGRGTGIDDEALSRKISIVESAIARLNGSDPIAVASQVGGYEIVGLAGVMLAAAASRTPVVVDGFIVTAAALLAKALDPNVASYLIASHRSREAGHTIALRALGLEPLLDLDMRLGEATGAALALPLIGAATRMISEMKTFAEAGVSTAEGAPVS